MIHPVEFISRPGQYQQTQLARQQNTYSKIILITDENTARLCKPYWDTTNVNYHVHINMGPLDESRKNLTSVDKLLSRLMEAGADRKTAVVVLGGGLLSDLAGFASSIYKRGLHLYIIPTTLLAMVDASLGGKNGVNYHHIKNQIGTIRSPQEVIIDPVYLQTLPQEEFLSGMAEMLKHGLIADSAYYREMIQAYNEGRLTEQLPHFIRKSVEIKMRVVQQDPHEKGLRKILNFGHTVGHALESCLVEAGKPVTHGHAVALGMIAALWLSVRYAGLDASTARHIMDQLRRIYPPVPIDNALIDCVIEKMKYDKKNTGNIPRFVLLTEPGKPVWDKKIPESSIRESLRMLNSL